MYLEMQTILTIVFFSTIPKWKSEMESNLCYIRNTAFSKIPGWPSG